MDSFEANLEMTVKIYRYGPAAPLPTLSPLTEAWGRKVAKSGSFKIVAGTFWVGCLLACIDAANADPPSAPVPPGYSTARTGDMHDFDYFVGGWITKQHRLKARGVDSHDWEEFPATLCMSLYLDGLATVDEMYMPTKKRAGLTLRTFDIHKRQWSIYWVSSADGTLGVPPVVGGFQGDHGEFYGEDDDNGKPIKVRYTWNKLDHDHARWEQAFSYDNRTWETNWIGDFARADPAQVCEANRPKR